MGVFFFFYLKFLFFLISFFFQDDFIRDLVLSGIPHECIFFYYHGLDAETSGIEKYETVVSGLELRMGIAQRVPLCAMRPAVSGVLYEAAKGPLVCLSLVTNFTRL